MYSAVCCSLSLHFAIQTGIVRSQRERIGKGGGSAMFARVNFIQMHVWRFDKEFAWLLQSPLIRADSPQHAIAADWNTRRIYLFRM